MRMHCHLCLEGALKNWDSVEWEGVCRDPESNHFLSPDEVRERFKAELAIGHTIIPLCELSECPDFDYTGGGCPGHDN